MGETGKTGSHMSSASAFVEEGMQDAFDDACSICLEDFFKSDPSTVTSCKHEFHLQCILEWCQRSSQCPMCWQPIILIDPTSQELLETVEHERSVRVNNARITTIFHHPAFRGFESQHLAVGGNNADMEEHFFQHSATAASIGRAHHSLRRGWVRLGSHEHQRCLLPPNSNTPSGIPVLVSATIGADNGRVHATIAAEPLASTTAPVREYAGVENVSPDLSTQIALVTSGTSTSSRQNISMTRTSSGQSSPFNQDGPGPTDLQSLSESLKYRLNSVSMKYRESITKSSRGWRDRLFSRSNSVADIGSELRREITAGIATVKSLMMEHLDKRENRCSSPVASPSAPMHLSREPKNHDDIFTHANNTHPNNISSNDGGIINHVNTHPNNAHSSSWVVTTSDPN